MKPVTSKSGAVSPENDCTALALPQLPRAVRYWDDFEETYRTLNLHEGSDHFIIYDDGKVLEYALSDIHAFSRAIALGIVGQILSTDDPSSATTWISHFLVWARKMPPQFIHALARKKPSEIQGLWTLEVLPSLKNATAATCVREVLHYLCRHHVGDWSPDYHQIVSRLPGPKVDPFAVARGGECFIPVSDQQVIYNFLDETCEALASGKRVGTERLVDATAIIFADQHAFRPGTIPRIRIVDVRIHNTGAIHVAAFVIKKHKISEGIQITRRVKADWVPIVRALVDRTKAKFPQFKQSHRLLGLTPGEIGKRIADRTQMLTGRAGQLTTSVTRPPSDKSS